MSTLPNYSTLKYTDRSGTLEIVDAMLAEAANQFVERRRRVLIFKCGAADDTRNKSSFRWVCCAAR